MNIAFHIHKWIKYCGKFNDVVDPKPMILLLILILAGEEKGNWGGNLRKIFTITPFPSYENALCDSMRALQKGTFVHLLKRSGVYTQDPLLG